MALVKQSADYPIVRGVNTKVDPKQIKFGELLSLENAEFDKPGKITKRNGFTSLGNTILGGITSLAEGKGIAAFKDELLAFDTTSAYSYVEGIDQWANKGALYSTYVRSSPVTAGTAVDFDFDSARHPEGLTCHIFSSIVSGVTTLYYTVIDSTGQVVVAPTAITTTGKQGKVVVFNNSFVLFYYDTAQTTLFRGVLPVGNVTASLSFVEITSDANDVDSLDTTRPFYTVSVMPTQALGNQLYLAFNNRTPSGGSTIRRYAAPAGTVSAQVDNIADTMFVGSLIYDRYYDGPTLALITESPYTVLWFTYSAIMADNLGNPDLLLYGAGGTVDIPDHITGVSVSSTEYNIHLYYDYLSASGGYVVVGLQLSEDPTLSAISIPLGVPFMVPTTEATLFTSYLSSIAADAFVYEDDSYLPIAGGLENTYFVLNSSGKVVAKAFASLGQRASQSGTLPWVTSVESISSTEFQFNVAKVSSFGEISGTTLKGISTLTVDFFEPEKSYSRAEIADTLHLGGGFLSMYDGAGVAEHSFHLQPRITSASPTTGGTGNTYQYRMVYEWVDNYGNLHRSTPSDAYTMTSSAAISPGNPVEFLVRPLTLTEKTVANGRNPVILVMYRTKANEDVFYRLPIGSANTNNSQANSQTIADDETIDADLIEELYTTGGVVENDAAPPVGALAVHSNRLFVADSTNPLQVWYSKVVSPGIPVQFSAFQTLDIDPSGGPVTALASLDDNLIVFKENQIRRVTGQGPDAKGANNDYRQSSLITTDCGCVNQRSIARIPQGILFKSRKGIYLLDKSLQVSYLGAPVEAFNSYEPTSAVLMPTKNQVRITLAGTPTVLVWDYFLSQWSTFTNISAVDSEIWRNTHVYIREDGRVLQQGSGYKDDGSAISMGLTSSWWSFEGISGFQRVYKMYLLNSYKSDHTLTVQLSYDFNEATAETITVSPEAPSFYGDDTYGDTNPYGGEYAMGVYEIRPSRQKCISIRLKVKDNPETVDESGQGWDLSNIRVIFGVKPAGSRLKDAQVFGGSA